MTVKIKYSDFTQTTRSKTLSSVVTSIEMILEVTDALLGSVFPFKKPVRLLGITLSYLNTDDCAQGPQLDLKF